MAKPDDHKIRTLVIGRNEILYDTVVRLHASPHVELVGIITAFSAPEYLKTDADFEQLAKKLGLPFLRTGVTGADFLDFIEGTKPDVAVSLNWVSTLDKNILDLFPQGVINAHFGDLPKYRGNAATNWALLQGESEITLTIHFMQSGEVDVGPVLKKKSYTMDEYTTIRDINAFARENVPRLFEDVLLEIKNGTVQILHQDLVQGFRCYPRVPEYGKIDWHQSAIHVDRLVRSLVPPYSCAYTYYRYLGRPQPLKKLFITSSRVVTALSCDRGVPGHVIKNDPATGESWIQCGQGVLAIRRCFEEGLEEFEPGRVWKSIRFHLGMDLEEEIYRMVTDK